MKSILSSFIAAAMIISEMHHDHLTNDNLLGNPCIPAKKKKRDTGHFGYQIFNFNSF